MKFKITAKAGVMQEGQSINNVYSSILGQTPNPAPRRLRRFSVCRTRPDQTSYNERVVIRNISEAKAQLSALIEEVLKGEEVILAKAGKPVAKLIRFGGSRVSRKPGFLAGKIEIGADFDVLPEDIAAAFGMADPKA